MPTFVLFESASGYGLFERLQSEEVDMQGAAVQAGLQDFALLSRMVRLVSFRPFLSAQDALENINAVSEGFLHDQLREFIEANIGSKKKKVVIGVGEEKLASTIKEALEVKVQGGQEINELIRGIRVHLHRFVKGVTQGDLETAGLGLAHAYSRSKVKFNVNRADNHIIQAIALLDQMDKDINTFAMRVREWYSWHFPELVKIVNDNLLYARLAMIIEDKSEITDEKIEQIKDLLEDDGTVVGQIIDAANTSMGTAVSELDMVNVTMFAKRVVELGVYRSNLQNYLSQKMHSVAPNLQALIGDAVGARLISHAGSLVNLAKCPASTVQILGAEKALFRAIKTKGNTPKYGLIFHSSFIGRAAAKNKGRVARCLGNKCSMASRIDAFSDQPTSAYGEKLKEQVEERLSFYDTGETPRKNIDVMREAANATSAMNVDDESDEEVVVEKKEKKEKKKKKKKKEQEDDDSEDETTSKKEKKKKKKKKDKGVEGVKLGKKRKRSRDDDSDDEEDSKRSKRSKRA